MPWQYGPSFTSFFIRVFLGTAMENEISFQREQAGALNVRKSHISNVKNIYSCDITNLPFIAPMYVLGLIAGGVACSLRWHQKTIHQRHKRNERQSHKRSDDHSGPSGP